MVLLYGKDWDHSSVHNNRLEKISPYTNKQKCSESLIYLTNSFTRLVKNVKININVTGSVSANKEYKIQCRIKYNKIK